MKVRHKKLIIFYTLKSAVTTWSIQSDMMISRHNLVVDIYRFVTYYLYMPIQYHEMQMLNITNSIVLRKEKCKALVKNSYQESLY